MDASLYDKHNDNASLESIVTQRQLTWFIGTLRNPRLRPSERQCLLIGAGMVLLDFLGRGTRGVGQ